MLDKVTHWAGHVSANTRPHQLHWGPGDGDRYHAQNTVRWLALSTQQVEVPQT